MNVAIDSRPHFLAPGDDETVAFIMADHLFYANVHANPHASYRFIEEGEGHVVKRPALTSFKEKTDPKKIQTVRRRHLPRECEDGEKAGNA